MTTPVGGVPSNNAPVRVAEQSNTEELRTKLTRLVRERFGGDWQAAFRHFDRNNDQGIDRGELLQLLRAARVGGDLGEFSRSIWADTIMQRIDGIDGPRDGKLQWGELTRAVSRNAMLDALDRPKVA